MTPNERTVNVKLTRGELCKVLLALTSVKVNCGCEWPAPIHDKLGAQLEAFDKKIESEGKS